jgi:hypothetical protein
LEFSDDSGGFGELCSAQPGGKNQREKWGKQREEGEGFIGAGWGRNGKGMKRN